MQKRFFYSHLISLGRPFLTFSHFPVSLFVKREWHGMCVKAVKEEILAAIKSFTFCSPSLPVYSVSCSHFHIKFLLGTSNEFSKTFPVSLYPSHLFCSRLTKTHAVFRILSCHQEKRIFVFGLSLSLPLRASTTTWHIWNFSYLRFSVTLTFWLHFLSKLYISTFSRTFPPFITFSFNTSCCSTSDHTENAFSLHSSTDGLVFSWSKKCGFMGYIIKCRLCCSFSTYRISWLSLWLFCTKLVEHSAIMYICACAVVMCYAMQFGSHVMYLMIMLMWWWWHCQCWCFLCIKSHVFASSPLSLYISFLPHSHVVIIKIALSFSSAYIFFLCVSPTAAFRLRILCNSWPV